MTEPSADAIGTDRSVGPARPSTSFWATTGIVFVGNVVARGLGFLFPVVLARAAGRDDFALAYFYINTGFSAGELVLAGFPTALTRFLAVSEASERRAWVVSGIAAGLPLLAASGVVGWLLADRASGSPLLLAAVIVGLTIDAYYFSVLRGLRRFGLLVGYRIAANLAQLVLLLIAIGLGIASIDLVVAIYAFVYLVPIAVIELAAGPIRGLGGRRPLEFGRRAREMSALAIPALITGTAYTAILGLDVFFVRVLSPASLPDYGAARALAMPMTLVSFAVGVTLMPRVATSDVAGRWRLLRQAILATAGLATLATLGYGLLGPAVFGVVFPSAFATHGTSLGLMAAAVGLIGVYSVLSQWWMGIGRPLVPAASLVTGALAAGAGHLALTHEYGAVGAAASIGIGAAVALVLLLAATVREYGRPEAGTAAAT